jgi:hypothetical protein
MARKNVPLELSSSRGSAGSVLADRLCTRKPQRITITVSWSVFEALQSASDQQGRSLSNLAAYWLERQAECPGSRA